MTSVDKQAWREAIVDTILGTMINFPVNICLLSITFALNFSVFWTAFASWFAFTIIAVVRKYFVRKHYAKKQGQ